jgi:hypothetical protein
MPDQLPNPDSDLTAKSKRFAKDVLAALDLPRSAEREANAAQKEREDHESLERFYRATGQRKATAAEALRELADAVERVAPEGPFEPVEIEIDGPGGRRAVMRIGASPRTPANRYAELQVYTPSGQGSSSQWMDFAPNAELAAFLRNTTPVEVAAIMDELVISQQRSRLA